MFDKSAKIIPETTYLKPLPAAIIAACVFFRGFTASLLLDLKLKKDKRHTPFKPVDVNVKCLYSTIMYETDKKDKNRFWTISELSDESGVTTRTIRFYEDKGLLHPQRAGSNRVYTYRDRARLQLILRGKRLGFSLDEIKEYLELYDAPTDPRYQEQLHYLLEMVNKRINNLERQQQDLQQSLTELNTIRQQCLAHIDHKAASKHTAKPD